MPRQISPDKLVLRCYAHQSNEGSWYGVCLELNLATEAHSPEDLRRKMGEMISSYIETVLDTEDKASIPALLTRRAPFLDWVKYYVIKSLVYLRRFPGNFVFEESIPFHLAHSC